MTFPAHRAKARLDDHNTHRLYCDFSSAIFLRTAGPCWNTFR